jgi:hypothetical protein
MRIRALAGAVLAAGALGVVPATALAGGTASTGPLTVPTPTTPTPTATTPTATTPAPSPAPAAAHVVRGKGVLYMSKLFTVKHASVTVPGRNVTVKAVVRPYRPGQRVLVQLLEANHVFAQKTLVLRPSARRVYGGFTLTVRAPKAGVVAVRVKHAKSKLMSAFSTERRYQVLSESVAPGATGKLVDLLQSRLATLHLYIPRTGVFDDGTELALDTYHRLLGQGEGNTTANAATINDLLNGTGAFHVRFPQQGYHAEGDLSDQVLAYANGDKVQYLLPISSGKPSTPTILGSYQVYRKQPEYTSDGMYFSNFFTGGYAIHGYDPAPDYPASHGCMRIPIVDAIFAYNLLTIGNWVDTYYT